MKKNFKVAIFTDLDGSVLHRDTFKFDPIKDYIVSLVNRGIIIIPNSSKTEKEIEKFNEELGVKLPYISENGSSIQGLNLINANFPDKIVLSREKEELIKKLNENYVDAGLVEVNSHSFGKSYAKTLAIWHKEFLSSLSFPIILYGITKFVFELSTNPVILNLFTFSIIFKQDKQCPPEPMINILFFIFF